MRSPIVFSPLLVLCLSTTFAFTQDKDPEAREELRGRIEMNQDGDYTLVLEDNKRVRLTSLPSSLVAEAEPERSRQSNSSSSSSSSSNSKSQESPSAPQRPELAEDLTWPDVIYSFNEGPSLATISEEESVRREEVERDGRSREWKVTGVELLRYSRTKPVKMRCTPVR
jgi:hypothetical protein